MRRLLKNSLCNSHGFTLPEMLVSIAISGIIIVVLISVTTQLIKVSPSYSDRITAIRNLDTAASWLVRDFQPSQSPLPSSVTLSPGTNTLAINQSVNASSDTTVSYTLTVNEQLQRSVDGNTLVIAEHIDSIVYSNGSPNTVQITATVGQTTITKTYKTISLLTS